MENSKLNLSRCERSVLDSKTNMPSDITDYTIDDFVDFYKQKKHNLNTTPSTTSLSKVNQILDRGSKTVLRKKK